MTSQFDLTGSLAVVTGASRGIGAGIALGLAQAGADIVGVARGDQGASADTVLASGRSYIALTADVSSIEGVRALVGKLDGLGRPVNILVNNAGIVERNPAEVHTDEQWATVLAVNLTVPFLLAREVGARMLERRTGRIIFIGSMMTWQGGRNVVGYTATKSGVAGVVRALANEWADRGVNVNAIAPGYIETEMTAIVHGDPNKRRSFVDRIPAGRWGTSADVAGAAVFLASPAAAYVHGVVLPVDGGWLVR